MPATMKQVLADALTLPPVDRAELIDRLFESFDRTGHEHLDRLWAQEAEDRVAAYERGEIGTIPASAVFEKINTWVK